MSLLKTTLFTLEERTSLDDAYEALLEASYHATINKINVELHINGIVMFIEPYAAVNKLYNEYKDLMMEGSL